jgi:hypothetical protein
MRSTMGSRASSFAGSSLILVNLLIRDPAKLGALERIVGYILGPI